MKYLSPEKGYNLYYQKYKNDYSYLDSFDWDIAKTFIIESLNIIGKYSNKIKSINILDIGCGDGRVLKRVINTCKKGNFTFLTKDNLCNFVGIDVSEKMLKLARKKIKCAKFFKLDIENNQSSSIIKKQFNIHFDIILSFFVLVHIKNINIFFSNISKLLKRRGFFIFNNIPQKSAPLLTSLNKKFTIKYYNHTNEQIENFFSVNNLVIFDKKNIYQNNKLISTVYMLQNQLLQQ